MVKRVAGKRNKGRDLWRELKVAVKRGVSTDGLLEDSDLASLRGDPRFMELVAR